MDPRNRLFGFAALLFGGAFALEAIMYAVRVGDAAELFESGELVVAESLAIVQSLVLALAAVFAAHAFFKSGSPRRGLRDAASLAGAGYGFGLLSTGFWVKFSFAESQSHLLHTATALECAFTAVFLVAALAVAAAFSQIDRGKRENCLGWAGIAFMAGSLLLLAAGVVRSVGYSSELGLGTLAAGSNLGATSFVASVAAGAIAAVAFFSATDADAPTEGSIARRDLLLATAVGLYGIFASIGVASEGLIALAYSNLSFPSDEVDSSLLAAGSELAVLGAVVCLLAGLQPPVRRALHRPRS